MTPESEDTTMKRRISPMPLSMAAGVVLLWHMGASSGQPILASGPDANVTEEGLHRVDPLIMEAAWVRPDLDLSRYTKILLVPTAVQFRKVKEQKYDAQTRIGVTEFPIAEEKKEWLRQEWRQAVHARLARLRSYELSETVGPDVLVVQGFLVDVVSHIPPDTAGSSFILVTDPWTVNVVLELRDAMTSQLLARTIDRRHAQGTTDTGRVWMQTEDLVQRWAKVLSDRLDQLSDLSRPR
jgi:hypothetical protein